MWATQGTCLYAESSCRAPAIAAATVQVKSAVCAGGCGFSAHQHGRVRVAGADAEDALEPGEERRVV